MSHPRRAPHTPLPPPLHPHSHSFNPPITSQSPQLMVTSPHSLSPPSHSLTQTPPPLPPSTTLSRRLQATLSSPSIHSAFSTGFTISPTIQISTPTRSHASSPVSPHPLPHRPSTPPPYPPHSVLPPLSASSTLPPSSLPSHSNLQTYPQSSPVFPPLPITTMCPHTPLPPLQSSQPTDTSSL